MEDTEDSQIHTRGQKWKNHLVCAFSLVTEYGIYLYIFLLFFDKGEGLRTLGLYGALTAWLALFLLKKITLSFDVITLCFFTFVITTILSSFFSIEPLYSLQSLKRDILKSAITFLIISTYFDTKMLLHLCKVICVSGIIILAFGLHSLLLGRTSYYTSENIFLSLDKNEFGFFVGIFCPFFILFFIRSKKRVERVIWGLSTFWAICGTLLSASRGAIINIFAAICVWAMFLLKREHLKKVLMVILIVVLLTTVSFNFWPELVKRQFLSMPKELWSFHERTYFFWKPAIEAVKKRPLFGWGYGNKIYRDQRPFENGEKPNWTKTGGLHSTFINILFHQGIVGLSSYLFLLFSSIFFLINFVRNETDDKRLLALSLLTILIGSFIINSLVLSVPFRRLAPILGMSAGLLKYRSKNLND
jgi:O-antigen ligase